MPSEVGGDPGPSPQFLGQDAPPEVRTPSGAVRGVWSFEARADSAPPARVAVFRGIPYAEPPVGPLRFAAPRARAPWGGIRDATDFGPTPLRGEHGITLIPERSVPGGDTLSVNVWTPDLAPDRLASVVVWIHGGGFISGSPASPWYDGGAFARDGVVLVSLTYRLGFIGFGAIGTGGTGTSATAPDSSAAGFEPVENRGVRDWICALEWVRDHISCFGGDPSRVTIAGQSAGGAAVLTLLGAPAANGLFHAAYAVSPAVADPSPEAARRRTARLARLAGVTPDAAGFALLDEARILELQPKITGPAFPRILRGVHELLHEGLMIGPIIDGDTVFDTPVRAAASGARSGVPLVVGTTAHELSGLFHAGTPLDHAPVHVALRALGARHTQAHDWLAAQQHGRSAALIGQFVTDEVFRRRVPAIAAARAAAHAGRTWTYEFDWTPAVDPDSGTGQSGAGHCSDVPFLFDRLTAPGVSRVAGDRPPPALADAVHGALVDFAHRHDPGWPADTGSTAASRAGPGATRIFSEHPRDVPGTSAPGSPYAAAALLNANSGSGS